MTLIMTLLVRDEQDILPANIEYHLSQGVDFIIATDNLSCDATPAILKHYERRGVLRCVMESEDNYYRFAFVRNPWDKLVSIYSNTDFNLLMQAQAQGIELKCLEFPEFIRRIAEIQHIHLLPQYDFIYAENGQCLVNFIGRFEQLQGDFAQVCQTLNLDIQLPHHNASVHTPYQDYYTEESKAWVGERYQVDIETFNYHF